MLKGVLLSLNTDPQPTIYQCTDLVKDCSSLLGILDPQADRVLTDCFVEAEQDRSPNPSSGIHQLGVCDHCAACDMILRQHRGGSN